MDKAGSYTETTGGQGGGYNQEDKYEREKKVSNGEKPSIFHPKGLLHERG